MDTPQLAAGSFHYWLDKDFKPYDLTAWYHSTEQGDMAVITLPNRACKVQLIRGYRDSVCGGRRADGA